MEGLIHGGAYFRNFTVLILRCSKRFDHRSHSIIFLLFEFKSVDDVGVGKLREMLTLHTNPHAVHGRFTLKDDCERQVWNAGAAS